MSSKGMSCKCGLTNNWPRAASVEALCTFARELASVALLISFPSSKARSYASLSPLFINLSLLETLHQMCCPRACQLPGWKLCIFGPASITVLASRTSTKPTTQLLLLPQGKKPRASGFLNSASVTVVACPLQKRRPCPAPPIPTGTLGSLSA
eukprot:1014879-Pelagomonas_calceolata.AAC.1